NYSSYGRLAVHSDGYIGHWFNGVEDFTIIGNAPPGTQFVDLFVDASPNAGTTLGIEDAEFAIGSTLRLYPNPVSEFLQIKLNDSSELKHIAIYNNLGQLVSKENKTQINVSNYSRGMYFVSIETANGKVTKKFVVE
ncbi:T9SS type A sorting domain-containing protein, partial [Gelidibacter japonicus]|uniref:T9SS type A sorting domain-containing protein n=1 Tax=Gelidibacter japonicus TaxID=1962232 RepID=UPI002021276B